VYYFYVHVSVDYVACKWRCAPFVMLILNKSNATIVFLDSDLYDAEIPAIREHLRQKLAYLCLHDF